MTKRKKAKTPRRKRKYTPRQMWKPIVKDQLLTVPVNKFVDVRADLFKIVAKSLRKENLTTRQIMMSIPYLLVTAGYYHNGLYADIVSSGNANDRFLNSLNISTTSPSVLKVVKKNGALDKSNLTVQVPYTELPINFSYQKFLEKNKLFDYVKDHPYLVEYYKVEGEKEVIKKPLFCMKKRTTNGTRLKGSFFDKTYTIRCELAQIFYMIHDMKMSANLVGWYYFFAFNAINYGRSIYDISNKDICQYFDINKSTIANIFKQLSELDLIIVLHTGHNGSKRKIKVKGVGNLWELI